MKHLIINAKGNVADLRCDGVHKDFGWNCPGLRTSAEIRDGEWCLEVAVPLSLFPSPLAGINLMRTRTHYLSHAMLVSPLHDPRFYPRIHLEDLGDLQYAIPPKVSIGKNRYAVKGMRGGRVAVHLNAEKQSEFDFSPGDTLSFPVDFTRSGKNHLAMSVSVKGKKDFVLTFTENPAAPLRISHVPAYLFQSEKMLSVRGSADINSPEDSAMTLEAHIGRGGSQVFQTAVPVTGTDFLLTLPLADLMPDTAYQIHFILRSPRHLLGEAKRCFFLMHDPL